MEVALGADGYADAPWSGCWSWRPRTRSRATRVNVLRSVGEPYVMGDPLLTTIERWIDSRAKLASVPFVGSPPIFLGHYARAG